MKIKTTFQPFFLSNQITFKYDSHRVLCANVKQYFIWHASNYLSYFIFRQSFFSIYRTTQTVATGRRFLPVTICSGIEHQQIRRNYERPALDYKNVIYIFKSSACVVCINSLRSTHCSRYTTCALIGQAAKLE